MATKKAVKRAVKAVEKPKAVEAEACCDDKRVLLAIGIVAVAVAAVVIAYLAMSGSGPAVAAGPFNEVMSGSLESMKSVSKATFKIDMAAEVSAPGQNIDISVSGVSKEDLQAKRTYNVMILNLGGMEGTIEMYVIGNTVYSKSVDPFGEESTWVKMQNDNVRWSMEGLNLTELMGALSGEVIGEEKVDGKDAYKMRVRPDLGKFMDVFLQGLNLTAGGLLTQGQVDQMVGLFVDSVKSIDLTLWVLKDSKLPVKGEGSAVAEMDLGQLYGISGAGLLRADVTFNFTVDYDSPVDITLPAEAANAVDMSEAYAPGNLQGGGTTAVGGTPAGGGTPSGNGTDIASAMAAGEPVECAITGAVNGTPVTMDLQMEAPNKVKMVINAQGLESTVVTSDGGLNVYVYDPQTSSWMKFTSETAPEQQNMDAEAIRQEMNNPPEGVSYDCRVVGDIPDSEFAPPVGAQVQDMSALLGACGDGTCGLGEDETVCPEDCAATCVDRCGDGTCDEIVCMAIGCPCAETPESCPEDCS